MGGKGVMNEQDWVERRYMREYGSGAETTGTHEVKRYTTQTRLTEREREHEKKKKKHILSVTVNCRTKRRKKHTI